MGNKAGAGSRWMAMSGRELILLALAVAVALGAVGALRLARHLQGPEQVDVTEEGTAPLQPERVNVNTAPAYELEMLPGIGRAIAQAIVHYRTEYGPFRSMEDLCRVRNMTMKRVEAIRPEAMCAPCEDGRHPQTM